MAAPGPGAMPSPLPPRRRRGRDCRPVTAPRAPRLYDWAMATLPVTREPGEGFERWLLVRRSITDPGELAYYLCFGPAGTIAELARIAGAPLGHRDGLSATDKGGVRAVGRGWQHVADLDFAVGDDHPVDVQLGQLSPLRERGRCEPGADGLAECLDPVGDGAQF